MLGMKRNKNNQTLSFPLDSFRVSRQHTVIDQEEVLTLLHHKIALIQPVG